ncbi:hypothetical protein [Bradyrhizobium sp.]|uniref:hypothetical protein n=1 Tax=Bradyrhizobium sp. TaxID=376 RepID=UPI002D350311|nr:hypothetical protein [Bradyrhizobium sp.]HZR73878.1 hypothetical protein [Bradyrhizobium sp.]
MIEVLANPSEPTRLDLRPKGKGPEGKMCILGTGLRILRSGDAALLISIRLSGFSDRIARTALP